MVRSRTSISFLNNSINLTKKEVGQRSGKQLNPKPMACSCVPWVRPLLQLGLCADVDGWTIGFNTSFIWDSFPLAILLKKRLETPRSGVQGGQWCMKRGKQGVKERACISFRLLHPGSENMSSCSGLANPLDMVKLQKKKRALEACFLEHFQLPH